MIISIIIITSSSSSPSSSRSWQSICFRNTALNLELAGILVKNNENHGIYDASAKPLLHSTEQKRDTLDAVPPPPPDQPTCKHKTGTEKQQMTVNTHRSPSCHVRNFELWHSAAMKSKMFCEENNAKIDTTCKIEVVYPDSVLDSHVPKLEFQAPCSPENETPSAAADATAANNNSSSSNSIRSSNRNCNSRSNSGSNSDSDSGRDNN